MRGLCEFSIVAALAVLTLLSCRKEKGNGSIEIYGHAGYGQGSPPALYVANSLESIEMALRTEGVNGVEMDVRISEEGTLWLVHDSELSALTNLNGCVESLSDEVLGKGRYRGLEGESLARLQDVLLLVKSGQKLLLDIKLFNECDQLVVSIPPFVQTLKALRQNYPVLDNATIVLNGATGAAEFLAADFHVMISSDVESTRLSLMESFPELDGFVVRNDQMDKNTVRNWVEKGKRIYLYGVRSPKEMKQVNRKNPSGVISDDVQSSIITLR